jgi:copper chaperone CopZ
MVEGCVRDNETNHKGGTMLKNIVKALNFLVCAVLVVQLAGCGTILYPERKGQRDGRIDVGVAVLDGIGLLFFIIPGVIAYAVDFSNGTIYLPGTHHGSLDLKNLKQVKFDPRHCTNESIEKIIKEETGYAVKLNQDNMNISRLKSIDEMMVRFAEVLPAIKNDRIELSMK